MAFIERSRKEQKSTEQGCSEVAILGEMKIGQVLRLVNERSTCILWALVLCYARRLRFSFSIFPPFVMSQK